MKVDDREANLTVYWDGLTFSGKNKVATIFFVIPTQTAQQDYIKVEFKIGSFLLVFSADAQKWVRFSGKKCQKNQEFNLTISMTDQPSLIPLTSLLHTVLK